jgi:hypothetical protein
MGKRHYSGTVKHHFGDYDLEVTWDVKGYVIPGRSYMANGDPGYPDEGEEESEIIEINGWPAERFLKHLEYWNPGAYSEITNHEPDTSHIDYNEPDDCEPSEDFED